MELGAELPPVDQLLALPVDEACRRVALALLDATAAARVRLDDPDDRTALHDFRVALRRLRSWIRAFDAYLHGTIRRKHRRRLRGLSRVAGACRDNEVHIAWLRDVEDSLRSRERPGAEWLLRRVAERQRQAELEFRATLGEDFPITIEALGDALAVFTRRVDLRDSVPAPSFAEAVAPLILNEATALGDRLAAVQSTQDQAVAHAARLAGKRLRYLLEPVAPAIDGGPILVKRLRHLQDTIGEMHDVHVMAEEVIEAAEHAGAQQARRVATALLEGETGDDAVSREEARDARPGLLAIAGQLRARGESAFTELQQRWLGEHARDLTDEALQVAAGLTVLHAAPTPAPATIDADIAVPEAPLGSAPVADRSVTEIPVADAPAVDAPTAPAPARADSAATADPADLPRSG